MEEVGFTELVLLVREIELSIEYVFKISLKQRLVPVNTEVLREFVELVELDEGHAETIKAALEVVLLPFAQFDGESELDEGEEVVVGELVSLAPEFITESSH